MRDAPIEGDSVNSPKAAGARPSRLGGGACWGLRGAEAILKLRSLRASGALDAYWTFHDNADHVRNHLDLYAAAPPPTIMPLKLVGRARLTRVPWPFSCRQREPHPFHFAANVIGRTSAATIWNCARVLKPRSGAYDTVRGTSA